MRAVHPAGTTRLPNMPIADIGAELVQGKARDVHLMDRFLIAVHGEEPAARARVEELMQQVFNTGAVDLQAEMLCSHVFHSMGLVQDCHLIVRK